MKGVSWRWSAEELAWIEANKELPRRELHARFVEKFSRREISYDTLRSLCKRKRWMTGRDGQYAKGSIPANKGKPAPYNPKVAATWFKKRRGSVQQIPARG